MKARERTWDCLYGDFHGKKQCVQLCMDSNGIADVEGGYVVAGAPFRLRQPKHHRAEASGGELPAGEASRSRRQRLPRTLLTAPAVPPPTC